MDLILRHVDGPRHRVGRVGGHPACTGHTWFFRPLKHDDMFQVKNWPLLFYEKKVEVGFKGTVLVRLCCHLSVTIYKQI